MDRILYKCVGAVLWAPIPDADTSQAFTQDRGTLHSILSALFDVYVEDAVGVISLLEWPGSVSSRNVVGAETYEDRFMRKFCRYLRGLGHPDDARLIPQFLSEDERDRVKGDRLRIASPWWD